MTPERRLFFARLLALIAVVGLSVYIYSIRDQAKQLAVYGYPGIFLLAFLAYATVLLPAPGIAFVFTMGGVLNPFGVGLAAGAGAALGELTGYLAGFGSQGIVERTAIHDRLYRWIQKYGSLTIFLLAAIPNPFFDLAGLIAGSMKIPIPKFLFWCWIGETTKMMAFAYLGARITSLFSH